MQQSKILVCVAAMWMVAGCNSAAQTQAQQPPATQAEPVPSAAEIQGFEHWLEAFRTEAHAAGISIKTLDLALPKTLTPNDKVVALDRNQPERKLTSTQYLDRVINDKRITDGKARATQFASALKKASRHYGVPVPVIVALWGIETDYGRVGGEFSVIRSLATLAYEGRRADFFRMELLAALQILDKKEASLAQLKGSWAGAMGQTQFMPSSFLKFAVDGNGDGRRDIWGTQEDVFASIAHYLHRSGWKDKAPIVEPAILPPDFDPGLAGADKVQTLAAWRAIGVRPAKESSWDNMPGTETIAVILPDGPGGPAYVTYDNFRVILKWNRSSYFGLAVAKLASAVGGE